MKYQQIINLFSLLFLLAMPVMLIQCDLNVDDMNSAKNGNQKQKQKANQDKGQDLCPIIMNDYEFEALSEKEIDAILLMREEEKLARDVYLKLGEKYDNQVFKNIPESEQRHMDAIFCLIDKYDLEDPAYGKDNGEFENEDLQLLYNTLIDQGDQNLIEALKVGATIEDLDIFDLMSLTEEIDNKDVKDIFTELTRASRNHLRAFNRNLTNLGGEYEPQYISPTLFNEIINSQNEQGGLFCNNGQNKGQNQVNNRSNCTNNGNQNNSACNGTGTQANKKQCNTNQQSNCNPAACNGQRNGRT